MEHLSASFTCEAFQGGWMFPYAGEFLGGGIIIIKPISITGGEPYPSLTVSINRKIKMFRNAIFIEEEFHDACTVIVPVYTATCGDPDIIQVIGIESAD